MQARSLLFTAPNQVVLDQAEIPEPGPGEVLIEIAYSCISPGTELRCLSGQQAGITDDTWPLIPGYSQSGRISARGEGVSLPVGAPVYAGGTAKADRSLMWGGHVGHALQAADHVIVLPEAIDLLDASILKLAAIAYHGIRHSRPLPHDKVAVIGLGPIGQLSARIHAASGAQVVAADLSPERVRLAQDGGIEAFVPTGGLAESFRRVFPDGADVVIDSTGFPSVAAQAIEVARGSGWHAPLADRPRFLIQGSYPADVPIPYQPFFLKEVSIFLPRDQTPEDLRAVVDLLVRGKLHVRDLISAVRLPEEAPRTYAELQQSKGGLLTAAFAWM